MVKRTTSTERVTTVTTTLTRADINVAIRTYHKLGEAEISYEIVCEDGITSIVQAVCTHIEREMV